MKRWLVLLFVSTVTLSWCLPAHANGRSRGCNNIHQEESLQNHGVLASSSKKTPKMLEEVSLSTNTEFFNESRFTGPYPQMNAKLAGGDQWLKPDRQFAEQIRLREQKLGTKSERDLIIRNARVKKTSGRNAKDQMLTEAQQKEIELVWKDVLKQTVEHYQKHHPELFAEHFEYTASTGRLKNKITGEVDNIKKPERDPLEILGKMTQEDHVLIMQVDGQYRMVSGFVAHPSNWGLRDFMGWSVNEIHKNAELKDGFRSAIDKLLTVFHVGARLTNKMYVRNNWFVTRNPEIGSRTGDYLSWKPGPLSAKTLETEVFIRMERETMKAFKPRGVKSRYILFTIKPHVFDLPTLRGQPNAETLVKGINDVWEGAPPRDARMVQNYLAGGNDG